MMLLAKLHAKKDEIEFLASYYGAKHIRVFGSVARQEETADSDIDFLVELHKVMICFLKDYRLLTDSPNSLEEK